MAEKPTLLSTEPDVLPGHGPCFVCGTDNPRRMGLLWHEHGNRVVSSFVLDLAAQGPPGYVHGGATAAIIDEAMGKIVWRSGHQVLLAHMELDYRRPTPLDVPLRCEAWIDHVAGKKVYARGHVLLADGSVAVEGTGLYLHVPQFFHGMRTDADARG